MKAIIKGKLILKDRIDEDKVIFFDDKIKDIVDKDKANLENVDIIDAKNNYVSPGFIDIHIHGSAGKDTMDADEESMLEMGRNITKSGVTSFLPTTMTMSRANIELALNNIKKCMSLEHKGANILGAHLEGPFISDVYKGAQDAKYIIRPEFDLIQEYLDIIKIIVIAPELDIEFEFLSKVKETYKNITVSIGHTNATFDKALESFKHGVNHITHMFNAMTPLHHREPGVVGAALSSDVTCELIADNIHVHPGLYQMFCDIKGIDKVVLITDSMRAGGLGSGEYDLGGQKVIVDSNSARLQDGTLAGSILRMNDAVRNIYNNTSLSLYEVVRMATSNPARAIGVDKFKGSLSKNKDADIVIFNEDLNIFKTIVNGNIVYKGQL
ncbi:N-acetylglucosamine-6-phosphate deacetylase [Clostridiaceae bacterium M8S5]|nr:N-acetylglucosamine-6-phosphate deacetylase [Clostridiaceae bacterium M8S5]